MSSTARLARQARASLPSVSRSVVACESEIGSGAFPGRNIPNAAVAIAPTGQRGRGARLTALASAFRALPVPVIGRIQDHALILDCRCLERESEFLAQLASLTLSGGAQA
jgi:L-seryl-tRNA(Ser) seleniumtransferase